MGTGKVAFFITPLSDQGSDIRRRADWVTYVILRPELQQMGYELKRAALTPMVAPITEEISHFIYSADLVIADVTDANPNVMYELGRRHAWGERCLLIADEAFDLRQLPFDISSHPIALTYTQTDDGNVIETYRANLGAHVTELESRPPRLQLGGTEKERRTIASRLGRAAGLSHLVSRFDGREDHYRVAQRLMDRPVKSIFLMQRSSTLVLGPEQGWQWERRFHELLLAKLGDGTNLYHLVSLEGISRHLQRRTSHFPEVKSVASRLAHLDERDREIVAISGKNGPIRFKKLPPESEESLKPDRQARTLITEFEDGEVEGLIVADLGESQSAFLFSGPEMQRWMEDCISYFQRCEYLYWDELEAAVGSS